MINAAEMKSKSTFAMRQLIIIAQISKRRQQMKKILCLCTILLMLFCLFACDTEQSSSTSVTEEKKDSSGKNDGTVKDGTVFMLKLDNQGATTVGSAQIFLKYNVGFYLDKNGKKEITDESGAITLPVKAGFIFLGYNVEKDGKGQTIITANGLLDLGAGYTDFTADTTLYAQWKKIAVYEINYYETKGAMNTNVTTFTESDNVTLNNNITAEGYSFLGWFDASTDGREVLGWVSGQKTSDVSLWAYCGRQRLIL